MKIEWCDQHDQNRWVCRTLGLRGCFGSLVEAPHVYAVPLPGRSTAPGPMTFTVLEKKD